MVASSDGSRAYISNYGGEGSDLNILSRIDLTTRQPLAAVSLGALHSAHGLVLQVDAELSADPALVVVPGGGWLDAAPEMETGRPPRRTQTAQAVPAATW